MIKIRKSVFETNSSSTHSLVYSVNNLKGGLQLDKSDIDHTVELYDFYGDDPDKGILGVSFGNYGWEGDPCSTFRAKLSYLLTQICQGYDLTYYGNKDMQIKIKSQKDWDNVINNYVMKDPKVAKVLDFIKKKCPNIKGFKFYWYDVFQRWEIKSDYRRYKQEKFIENKREIPNINDKFFQDYSHKYYRYLIGFGGVDHQSAGILDSDIDLDKYLFDDNLWVIITNDNR